MLTNPLALERAVRLIAREVDRMISEHCWAERSEAELWHELVACILGSNVRFEQARDAMRNLRSAGLLEWQNHMQRLSFWKRQIERFLRENDNSKSRYRFPRIAASRICCTAYAIYGGGDNLKRLLNRSAGPESARLNLIDIVHGVGPKQASLFLRNIGYASEFAILDRHVLQFMSLLGFSAKPLKVNSIKQYVFLEKILRVYTRDWQVSFSSVDTAIWVFMRTSRL